MFEILEMSEIIQETTYFQTLRSRSTSLLTEYESWEIISKLDNLHYI